MSKNLLETRGCSATPCYHFGNFKKTAITDLSLSIYIITLTFGYRLLSNLVLLKVSNLSILIYVIVWDWYCLKWWTKHIRISRSYPQPKSGCTAHAYTYNNSYRPSGIITRCQTYLLSFSHRPNIRRPRSSEATMNVLDCILPFIFISD